MIRVFIGFDQVEAAAFHTLCHSIWRRASQPVQIIPLQLTQLKGVMWRDRDPLQSNEFAFSRWLIPYLCGFEGQAIFMDCDMLVLDDITKLWDLFDPRYVVQVVKHKHNPVERTKFLGAIQSRYEKKNWSSVMLFNNTACRMLTPDYVNTASGLDLHQFKWLGNDGLIGALPLRWNYLADYCPTIDPNNISNIHYTIGGPYFEEYKDCAYGDLWWDECEHMIHVKQAAAIPIQR